MEKNIRIKIIGNLLASGQTQEQIRVIPIFSNLSSEEFVILFNEAVKSKPQLTPRIEETKSISEEKKISVRMPIDLYERLKGFIKWTGTSSIDHLNYLKGKAKVSQVIRLSLEDYLNKYFPEKEKWK
jgi:hypothetical protein